MFTHKALPSRIYTFRANRPDDVPKVMDQLWHTHRYKNKLVELELARRAQVEEALLAHSPALVGLEARIAATVARVEEIYAQINARNQKNRNRTTLPEEKIRLAALRHALKADRADRKAARAQAFADGTLQPALDAIDAADAAARRDARAAAVRAGIVWGCYLMAEAAYSKICKGAPPRYRRFTGDGAIAVQLQGGLSWEKALACTDTRLRIQLEPAGSASRPDGPHADPNSVRSRDTLHAVVWFRIGSGGGGRKKNDPVWVKAPAYLLARRVPPEGTQIKWAYLRRRLVGRTATWEVQFVLSRESWHRDRPDAGVVGVDINWRVLPEGLRVATAIGGDDEKANLFISDWHVDGWRKSESLQSIRDSNFDAIRRVYADWKKAHPDVALPEWLVERTKNIGQWRAIDKLTAIVWHWKDDRFAGDEEIFPIMREWRRQDRHLHNWQDFQRRKIVKWRDEKYRRFAALLASRYREVHLEDINWKKIKASPLPDATDMPHTRIYVQIAAPGRLAAILREAFAEARKVKAANTTRKCHHCGRVDTFDAAKELVHRCTRCERLWDQDENAARNLRDDPGVPFGNRDEDADGGGEGAAAEQEDAA